MWSMALTTCENLNVVQWFLSAPRLKNTWNLCLESHILSRDLKGAGMPVVLGKDVQDVR
jgi:hypothetical protein